jgi:hypothetical protein
MEPARDDAAPHGALEIRPVVEGDEPAILELLRLTVGQTSGSRKTEAFWRWKHAASPFGRSYALCAIDPERGSLAGLRALMWWSFQGPDGSLIRAVRPVDTATHPDYQRRGVFSSLTRRATADLGAGDAAFIFNTPNQNSLPGYIKMGWEVVARWPLYMRPARWLAVGGALLSRRGNAGQAEETETLPRWQAFRGRYGDEVAGLIESNESGRKRVGYRTLRTLSYMDWRYGAHPDVEYVVHAVNDSAGLVGAAVGRVVPGPRGLRAFLLTELMSRFPSASASARLLRSLFGATRADYLVAHFADGTFERAALVRTGFLRAPRRGYTFVAYPLAASAADATDANRWDLSIGELEIF